MLKELRRFYFCLVVCALGLTLFVVGYCDPSSPEIASSWHNWNDTISVSSNTPTKITASNGGYRAITLGNPTSTTNVFYRLDQSSQTISTTGLWFNPSLTITIESNGIVWLQLAAQSATVTLRRLISTK